MAHPSGPLKRRPWDRITLAQLHRIKRWREAHHGGHLLERQVWEVVLMCWMMGWVGWIPAFVFHVRWAYPLCLMGIWLPRLYVYGRARAHAARRLRCDWLDLIG